MTQIVSPLLLILLLALPNFTYAQSCECTNCPRAASAGNVTTINFEADGATNNDLSDPGQGVCGVYIEFAPDHIWSLEMILTSPGGQQVTLIGPPSNTGFFSGSLTWEVLFLPCGETVEPDAGFPNTWNNSTMPFTIGGFLDGSYYPNSGCLEDFNMGSVDGTWTLSVNNISFVNTALIWDFKVLFCDDSGLPCFPCEADAGSIAAFPDITACPGDATLDLSLAPDYGAVIPPDPLDYGYTYIISSGDVILDYDATPDLTTYPSGTYSVCGLSYEWTDSLDIPNPNGSLTMTDLEADLNSILPPFCGDITNDCLEILIQDIDTLFRERTICAGTAFEFNGQSLDTTGLYYFAISGGGPCGRVVEIDLLVLDSIRTFLTETICTGEEYCIGASDCFSTSGNYKVTLNSDLAPFCDSIVYLALSVDPNPAVIIRDTICAGDSVVVRGETFYTTGNYDIFPDPLLTCDTFFRLRLQVIDPIYTIARDTLCVGDSLEIEGQVFDTSGVYEINYPAFSGCDSILQINLTILDSIKTTVFDTICAGDTTWIDGTPFFVDGYFEVGLNSIQGCDSLVQLHLEVRDTIRSFVADTICQGQLYPVGGVDLDSTGQYEIVVPTAIGCDSFIMVDLLVLAPLLVEIDSTICQGETVRVGNREYNETGEYITVLTSSQDCDSIVHLNLVVLNPSASIAPIDLLGCENNPVQLDASGSDGMNLIFQWIDLDNGGAGIVQGADSAIAFVNMAGTYELIVTDTLNGQSCSVNNFVGVAGDLNPPTVFSDNDTLTCTDTLLQLNIIILATGLDFAWTGPGSFDTTLQQPFVNTPGTYTLITTASNSCKDTSTIIIAADTLAPQVMASVSDSLDCNTLSVALTGSATGDIDAYSWIGPPPFLVPLQNATTSIPGNYTFVAIGENGCLADTTLSVGQDTISPMAEVFGDTIFCDSPDAELSVISSNPNLLFNWFGPGPFSSGLPDPLVSLPGTYSLTITSTNGCTAFYTTEVLIDTITPNLSLSGEDLTCDSTSIQLMASSTTPDVSYSWAGPGTFNTSIPNPRISEAGVYYLTVTSANFCETIDSITINQDTLPPEADAIGGILQCDPDSLQLFASSSTAGVTFLWSGPGISTSDPNPFVKIAGEYILQVTGPNGCVSIDTALVIEDINLPGVFATGDTLTCKEPVAQLQGGSPTAGVSYLWTGPSPFIDSPLPNPTTTIPGTYTLTVLSNNGCESQTTVMVLEDLVVPDIFVAGDTLNCRNDSIQLQASSATANLEISWTGPVPFTSNVLEPFVQNFGTYILILTASNGCTATDTAFVAEDKIEPGALATGGTIDCLNDSIDLAGNSILPIVVDFAWTGPGGFVSSIQNPRVGVEGEYILIVSAANGCTSTDTTQVLEDIKAPGAFAMGDTLTCVRDSVQLLGNSPSAGVSYAWEGPSPFVSDLQNPIVYQEGFYVLTVIGTNACTSLDTFYVESNIVIPDVSATVMDTLDCQGLPVSLFGTSISSGPSYSWTGPSFSSVLQNPLVTEGGEYILRVALANGCEAFDTVQVEVDTIPPGAIALGDTLGCGSNISIQLFGDSPTTNVSYAWIGPGFSSNNQNPIVSSPGNYILTVTGANTCTSVDTALVVEDSSLPGAFASTDTLFCGIDSVQLLGASPTPGVDYIWIGPGAFFEPEQNPFTTLPGNYTLFVTGSNGCESQQNIEVIQDTLSPVLSFVADTLDCAIDSIQIFTTSSIAIQSFSWTGVSLFPNNVSNPFVQEAGTYVLQVVGENYCTNNDSVLVSADRDLPNISIGGDTLNCNRDSIQLMGNSTTGGVTYSWTGVGGFNRDIQNPYTQLPGEYILSVLGPNACEIFDTIEIAIDTLAPGAIALGDTLGCLAGGAQLTGIPSGMVDSVFWEGPGAYTSTELTPVVSVVGNYIFTVTGMNGCQASDTALVIEDVNLPGANIIGDTLTCVKDTIQLLGSSPTSPVDYFWTGPGISNPAIQNPEVSVPGLYTLEITGSNGCASQQVFQVLEDIALPDVLAIGDSLTCQDSTLQLSGFSTTSDVTYSWTGPGIFTSNLPNPIVTDLGEYILTITSANGCTAADTVQLIDEIALPGALATGDTINCLQDTIQLLGDSPTAMVDYSWTGPDLFNSSLQNPQTGIGGTYILTVTSPETCQSFDTIFVAVDTLVPGAMALGDTLDCNGGGVVLAGSSATSMVEYAWEGPGIFADSIANPTVNTPGVYILTVTGVNGCTSVDSTEVFEDIALPGANIMGDTLDCWQDSIQLLGSSTTGISYSWTGPATFTFSGQNPFVTAPGEYELTVIGANACQSQAQFTVIEDRGAPGAMALGDTLGCIPEPLQVFGNSTDPLATYAWQGPSFSSALQNPLVPAIGEYILIVTGANGCTATDTTQVIEDIVLPDVLAIGDTINCRDTLVQILGSSLSTGVSYSWEGPNGFTSIMQSPFVDTTGTYILTVLSPEGCEAKDTALVSVDDVLPGAIALGDTLSCRDTLVSLSGDSPTFSVTYFWEGPSTFTSGLQNPTVKETGTYVLFVEGENYCVSTDTLIVEGDYMVPGAIATGDTINCTSGPFSLQGNSTITMADYFWEGPSPFVATDDQNPLITVPGQYFLTVTGENGCTSMDSILIVEDDDLPGAIAEGDTLICQPDSVQIFGQSPTAGVSYAWTGPNSFNATLANPYVDAAGSYALLVTGANGCTSLDTAQVIADQIYPLAIASGDTLDCDSLQITLMGSSNIPAVTYTWQGPGSFMSDQQFPMIDEPGTYILQVSGANQCVSSDTIEIARDVDAPDISAMGDTLNCTVDIVQLIGSSLTPLVNFLWTGPGSFQSIEETPLVGMAGEYQLIVEALNGCQSQLSVEVVLDTLLPMFEAFGDTLDCNTGDGLLSIDSALPGYIYHWTGPLSFNSLLPNPVVTETGTYQLLVTAPNTCQDSVDVLVIDEPNLPVAEAGEAADLDCDSFDVLLDGSASTGDPGLIYTWTDGQGTFITASATTAADSAGIYYLEVTNPSNNCSAFDSVIVEIDTITPLAVVDLIGGQSITCTQTSIVLDGTGSIASDSLLYNWWLDGGLVSTEINPEVIDPGSYTLVVTNAVNACVDSVIFDILLDNQLPTVQIIDPDILNCYQDTMVLDASNSDTSSIYSLVWGSNGPAIISGASTAFPVIDQPGDYTLLIVNTQNGCRDSASVTVSADFNFPLAEAGAGGTLDCQKPVYVLNGTGSSVGVLFDYQWDGPGILNGADGLQPEVDQAGWYVLEVFNGANGCASLDSTEVVAGNLGPTSASIDLIPIPCHGEEEGMIIIDDVNGGVGPFLYSLNGAPFVNWSQFAQLGAGTYRIDIEDTDGCELDTTLTLNDPLPLTVQLGRDTLIQLGESIDLQPIVTSSNFDPTWDVHPFLPCDTCLAQTVSPFLTSTFILTVTDQNGCTASADRTIFVEEGNLVFIPSAFSPDGDGTNDVLEIYPAIGVVGVKSFLIFDRWGEVVHERRNFFPGDPSHGWDGRLRGQLMNPAVFVYYAELELVNGATKFFKGSITLMR